MICTTLQNKNIEQLLDALAQCEMAEIRLDRCSLSEDDIQTVFSSDRSLVATCRIADLCQADTSALPEAAKQARAAQKAENLLTKAIVAGASWVDVEMEAPKEMSKRLRSLAYEYGTTFIRSYHDFTKTPSEEELGNILKKCLYHGADLVKIVTTASCKEDVERVFSLYKHAPQGRLIAFCMGKAGRDSRLDCLLEGAPYTYACLDETEAAAPGQIPFRKMMQDVYGDFTFIKDGGPIKAPASKSYAQRAIIAASLAEGVSVLEGYTSCSDTDSAVRVARALGARVEIDGERIEIEGIGASCGQHPLTSLNVGESGLLTRMMIPLCAAISPSKVEFTGEKTLCTRPLKGVRETMEAFGARVESQEDTVTVPFSVCGPLKNGRIEVSGSEGSQLITGLLMALPLSHKNTTLVVHNPKSIPYLVMTLEVLKRFGIKASYEMLGDEDFLNSDGDLRYCTDIVFRIKGNQRYRSADFAIEGDWSGAANLLVIGAVFGSVTVSGLNTESSQADFQIVPALVDAGAVVSQLDEPEGDITVTRGPLTAFSMDASNCPDLFPILSVLALFCDGNSRISGLGRLSTKESDRKTAILDMLEGLGQKASVDGDTLVVSGCPLARRLLFHSRGLSLPCGATALLRGGRFTSRHDHRMAMALSVASLAADSPLEIDDKDCVAKSYPHFNHVFDSL
ncbi:MAG: 3-phosphoshikimate 1-carboxyvinyltransferase [Bacteroidales bacterium]|nr:3-phosphoshikimate 1-carboxyvinyltransferase [Bacteroidales bacterium]